LVAKATLAYLLASVLWFLYAVWPGTIVQLASAGDQDDQALREKLAHEAPRMWEDYAQRAKYLQGKMTSSLKGGPPGAAVTSDDRYTTKANESCRIIEIAELRSVKGMRAPYRVVGINPSYAFLLQRKAPDAEWAITELPDLSKDSLPGPMKVYLDSIDAIATVLVRFDNKPLVDLLKEPGFAIRRCRKISEGAEEHVEVTFRYSQEKPSRVQEGSMVLDPQRFWCLRSYEVRTKTGASDPAATKKWRTVELGEAPGGLPVPRSIVLEVTARDDSGNKVTNVMRLTFDLAIPSWLPGDSEFTLSAFGLPEPDWSKFGRATPWYVWVAIAGVVCLMVGGFFVWRNRRAA
jgi:hypothetical protein